MYLFISMTTPHSGNVRNKPFFFFGFVQTETDPFFKDVVLNRLVQLQGSTLDNRGKNNNTYISSTLYGVE
jgi:hypothetical protein